MLGTFDAGVGPRQPVKVWVHTVAVVCTGRGVAFLCRRSVRFEFEALRPLA